MQFLAHVDIAVPGKRQGRYRDGRESRAPSKRADYPERDPSYDGKFQTIQKLPDGSIEQKFRDRVLRQVP